MSKKLSPEEEAVGQLREDYATRFGFSMSEDDYAYSSEPGLSEGVVREISRLKNEPEWMLQYRLQAYRIFQEKPLPTWGADLSTIDFDAIRYFVRATDEQGRNWDDVPPEIKETFDKLGIPEAEQKYLQGVTAQYDSEVVYHNIRRDLEEKGVIFTDTDSAVRDYPDLVKEYFGTIIPSSDNKFAALNTAVWSGGSFIYVPPGVEVEMPLQAYFRINAKNMGQFERTLIIVDEGASVHYVEGCTAPIYSTDSLHSAVVEILVKPGGRCRYTTIQNWSNNVYNLVTKRAIAHQNATMEWVDANLGSKITMKYPGVVLAGEGAHGEVLSLAFAGSGQHQDTGAKMTHLAPRTTSKITSKSISVGDGLATYRGLVKITPEAVGAKNTTVCDALLLGALARTETKPTLEIEQRNATAEHEASVSRIGEEQLHYVMSRGIPEDEARGMIVNGFIEPLVKVLPMEYAIEMNRLILLQLDHSVG